MKPCIVYLAQNTKKDLQYGRDSRSLLVKSLELLYKNYNDQFQQDVLIFHEGDFSPSDQEEIQAGRPTIHFHKVVFKVPDFLPQNEVPEIWTDGKGARFGLGHRHMIRFYAFDIFSILSEMGYDWMMRMDDDSFIHTPITYDLFAFMKTNDYRYGYRVDILEPLQVARGYHEAVQSFVKAEGISPSFFEKQKASKLRELLVAGEAVLIYLLQKLNVKRYKDYVAPLRIFPYWSYYNNFFISDIAFWQSEEVQSFIGYMDRIGAGYKYRWNDLIIQSTAVQLFMPQNQVHKFSDWTYEHATIKKGTLKWGGIYPGKGQENLEAVRAFEQEYAQLHLPLNWSK